MTGKPTFDLDEVEFLADCGVAPAEIARRLGVAVGAIARRYERAGEYAKARHYNRIRKAERRALARRGVA